jgi:hypothetical protein
MVYSGFQYYYKEEPRGFARLLNMLAVLFDKESVSACETEEI